MMKTTPSQRVTSRLRADCKAGAWKALPAIHALAVHYGVSYCTMWKAVRALKKEGLLAVSQGTRVKLKGATAVAPTSDLCAEVLRTGILNGAYRPGDPMPKYDYVQHVQHLSRSTVKAAFARLAQDNLIHKEGKSWIAGPAPLSRAVHGPRSEAATVLMVVRNAADWNSLFNNFFLAPAITMFRGELSRADVRILPFLIEEPSAAFASMSGNLESLRSMVRGLGERYRGAFLQEQFAPVEELRTLVLELSAFGSHPVCYFDFSGARDDMQRAPLGLPPCFYRLYLDEKTAVAHAIDALINRGHRRIGYAMLGGPGAEWMTHRLDRLTATARMAGAEILPADLTEPFWIPPWTAEINKHSAFARQLDAFMRRPAGVAGTAQSLLSITPSLRELLRAGATALVAPNDWLAQQVYLWCRSAGIAVPNDLSMITFDNTPDSEAMPITNIDFGLGHLGFMAAHIILDDIPLKAPNDGRIPGPVRVMDRGSIGKARPA
jgi:DNA-binding transcriptional regulator YhcF (GntR family)